MPRHFLPILLLTLGGCSHTEPFPPGDHGSGGPFDPAPPIRLTFDAGQDRTPAWQADGRHLLYGFQLPPGENLDECLGILPVAGGSRTAEKCTAGDPGQDSVDVLTSPASSPEGRIAWVQFQGRPGFTAPERGGIRVGSFAASEQGELLRVLPYLAPDGDIHATATHLAWLSADELVYVGADVFYGRACQGCKLDTLVIGRDVTRLSLATRPAIVSIVPGTSGATSVWPETGGAAIEYTLVGSSQVFRQELATGAITTLFDFGAAGIARDVSYRDSLLVAVVGGLVNVITDPLLGTRQTDDGGDLYLVDLRSGIPLLLTDTTKYARRPALSPDGTRIAAELVPQLGPYIADLYRFDVP